MRLKHYIFTEKLTPNLKKKNKYINVIYNSSFEDKKKFINFLNLNYYCKKRKIPMFVINNTKIAIKYKLNGIFLTSDNKRFTLTPHIKKNLKLSVLVIIKWSFLPNTIKVVRKLLFPHFSLTINILKQKS